ncbi:MAG: GNAT family N-acetyltransferase [Chitinophagales bacterium]|nr:GNAT family N-acetyltransferase [Chitinophagales bacterium]MDW8428844.1 GNAT family N-acetyltransferase [Chitinophagales bacterium]
MSRFQVLPDPPLNLLLDCYDQHPDAYLHQWPLLPADSARRAYAFLDTDNQLMGYVLADAKPLRALHVAFGPVGIPPNQYEEFFHAWLPVLQRQRWWRLSVQLPLVLEGAGLPQPTFCFSGVPCRTSDRVLNWATWVVSLHNDENRMLHAYSAHHRRNIRKAWQLGLYTQTLTNQQQILQLVKLYKKLYKWRRLQTKEQLVCRQLLAIHDYFFATAKGFILGIFHQEQLLGGVVVALRAQSAFYHFGVTDPEMRPWPLAHLLFHHAFLKAASMGLQTFDFGGYDQQARPGSQTFAINRFKEGFGGSLVTYVPQLIFDLSHFGSYLTDAALLLRHWLRQAIAVPSF